MRSLSKAFEELEHLKDQNDCKPSLIGFSDTWFSID